MPSFELPIAFSVALALGLALSAAGVLRRNTALVILAAFVACTAAGFALTVLALA